MQSAWTRTALIAVFAMAGETVQLSNDAQVSTLGEDPARCCGGSKVLRQTGRRTLDSQTWIETVRKILCDADPMLAKVSTQILSHDLNPAQLSAAHPPAKA